MMDHLRQPPSTGLPVRRIGDVILGLVRHLSQPVLKERKRFRLSKGSASTVRQKACTVGHLSSRLLQ